MGEKEKEKKKLKHQLPSPHQYQQHYRQHHQQQQQQQQQPNKSMLDPPFKQSSDVKGLRFGGQFVVKSFTVRRASPLELLRLLSLPPTHHHHHHHHPNSIPFPSTITYLPTNFTILAHHAWHTLTLGVGTKKSKVVVFIFESESLKSAVDRFWPSTILLGEVNKKLIRGLPGCEMARFKFRKGCITFYLYAVRHVGDTGFVRSDDLRLILQSVVGLQDFIDHTAMLALPNQRSICFSTPPQVAMAH